MLFHIILNVILTSWVLGAPSSRQIPFRWRIVNGTDAKPGQYPYQVSLQYDKEHTCGATIISDKWILTAAHCVDDSIAADFTVLAGTIDLNKGGVTRNVVRYYKHDDYDIEDNYKNDIAIVELASALPIDNTNIRAVTLPSQSQGTRDGLQATVIGWGQLYSDGPTSDILQTVNLLTYSDSECYNLLGGNSHSTNICAGVPGGGKGHCGGDSGGPLIVNGYQAGIVSWSVKPCASPPYPGVYTEVSHYINWIKQVTKIS